MDRVYTETVVYGLGGTEYNVGGRTMVFVSDSADVTVNVVIEKLNDTLYPMMKKLSAVAPYLTAYRCGIIFGKPEFAFVGSDETRTKRGEHTPGTYQPRINHALQYASNKHVLWINEQINELLAKLVDIDLNELDSLQTLREYYKEEELLGKQIVVVRNLQPAVLRGIESEGMLLAAEFKGKVVLLGPEKEIETGAKIR